MSVLDLCFAKIEFIIFRHHIQQLILSTEIMSCIENKSESTKFSRDGINYDVGSVGGMNTIIYVRWGKGSERGILIDAGGIPNDSNALNLNHVFFTHLHADHFKQILKLVREGVTFYVPIDKAEPLENFLRAYADLTENPMWVKVIGLDIGDEIILDKGRMRIQTFRTFHDTACNGYVIGQLKRIIKPEYINCSPDEKEVLGKMGKLSETKYINVSAMTVPKNA